MTGKTVSLPKGAREKRQRRPVPSPHRGEGENRTEQSPLPSGERVRVRGNKPTP